MKVIFKVLFPLFFFFFLLFSPSIIKAQENSNIFYVPETKEINGLIVKKAEDITIDGIVNGETYLTGDNIIINGKINDDAVLVAKNVEISGEIMGSARIISERVHITGLILKNSTIIASRINLENKSNLGGNLFLFGLDSQITGKVKGESYLLSRRIFIDGSFEKNVQIDSPRITFGQNVRLKKDLISGSSQQNALSKIQLQGKFIKKIGEGESIFNSLHLFENNLISKYKTLQNLLIFVSYLAFGFILTFIFPKNFTNISHFVLSKPLASFILGFVFFAILPILLIILMLSIVGIPIALSGLIFVSILIFVSRIAVSLALGNLILKDYESKFFPLFIGLCVFQIIFLIPFFGLIVKIIIVFLGSGSILLSKFGRLTK